MGKQVWQPLLVTPNLPVSLKSTPGSVRIANPELRAEGTAWAPLCPSPLPQGVLSKSSAVVAARQRRWARGSPAGPGNPSPGTAAPKPPRRRRVPAHGARAAGSLAAPQRRAPAHGTHPAGQDAERPLVDVHDGIVLPFVAIHFLKRSTRHHQQRDKPPPSLSPSPPGPLPRHHDRCVSEEQVPPSCSDFGQRYTRT